MTFICIFLIKSLTSEGLEKLAFWLALDINKTELLAMQKQMICLAPQLLHWLSAPGILWILAGSWVCFFMCFLFIWRHLHWGSWWSVRWSHWMSLICCEFACVWGRAVRYLVLQWSLWPFPVLFYCQPSDQGDFCFTLTGKQFIRRFTDMIPSIPKALTESILSILIK